MRVWRTTLSVVVSGLLMTGVFGVAASADDGSFGIVEPVAPDPIEPDWVDFFGSPEVSGTEGGPSFGDSSSSALSDPTDMSCPQYPLGDAHQTVAYRQFTGWNGWTDINVDIYQPHSPAVLPYTQYPALVVLHGGSYWRSCRVAWAETAQILADTYQFVVYNADYRLACDHNQTGDIRIRLLCDWQWTEEKAVDGEPAAVSDVLYLIQRIRNEYGDLYTPPGTTFNDKVAVMGGSAGGGLAYLAGARGIEGQNPVVNEWADAVIGFSGAPTQWYEFRDGTNPCDEATEFGSTPAECWAKMAVLLGCPVPPGEPTDPVCIAWWNKWSSADAYGTIDDPANPLWEGAPAFIANSSNEPTVTMHHPKDLQARMRELFFLENRDLYLCEIPGSAHGQDSIYAPHECLLTPGGIDQSVLTTSVCWAWPHVRVEPRPTGCSYVP